jgi:hypothetical protein
MTASTAPAWTVITLTEWAKILCDSHPERWGRRIVLIGYTLFAAGLLDEAAALLTGADAVSCVVFLAAMLPGLFVSLVGSTLLGVTLLRAGIRPRMTA